MSTLKNVGNKIFKVELSSIKEVKEAINAIKNMDQDATKVIESYEKKISEAAAAYDVVMKERNAIYSWVMTSAPSIISDFEKKAKDLGLDINDNPDVIQLKKLIEQGKELYKVLDNDYLKNSPRKLL
jgi:hypothetical protein